MSVTNAYAKCFSMLGLAIILAGCSGEPPLAETPPLEVIVSQALPPGAKPELITDWDTYTGTVESQDSVEIRSRVHGHIKEVRFTAGEEIASGTELFLIDSDPFEADRKQAQGQLSTWEAKLKLAEEKIAFYKPLADKGSVSKEELLQVTADKGEAIGNIDVARGKILNAELNIGYCNVTSPIAGRVGEALIKKGNLVNSSGADSLLTTVEGVDPMFVYFYVNERAFQNYRRILLEKAAKDPASAKDKLIIPVEMAVASETRFGYKGFVDFVDNRVDPGTSSIKVRAKFDNPKGPDGRRPLTAGMFARIRVAIEEPHPAVLVADRAVLTDQSLKYVLVVNKAKNNVVERVDVLASNRLQEDGRRAVEAGLKGDEWVIVEGVNRARPGITVNPTEGKMPRRPVGGK
jgi:RND family efflux transporter MFP subunit